MDQTGAWPVARPNLLLWPTPQASGTLQLPVMAQTGAWPVARPNLLLWPTPHPPQGPNGVRADNGEPRSYVRLIVFADIGAERQRSCHFSVKFDRNPTSKRHLSVQFDRKPSVSKRQFSVKLFTAV